MKVNMTRKIQPLSSGVVKKIRSGISLTSISHCVEELILNSIDAGATCIAVHLNLPFCQIQVIDNGCGIDLEQLKVIGTRYATSKCHTLEDLQNLKCGGFRGEALSSLKEVSSILMIETRPVASNETYCKIFTQGRSSEPKKSLNSRPSKGTTVSVYDFMYNMPVRKSTFSEALDLEECRKLLQSIAIMHPDISFTLKNEATGEMCLQLRKCKSVYHTFFQIFGQVKANNLKSIDYQIDSYELNGYINTDCHVNKDLQFLYVNKRLVLRTKIHKLINSILNKALYLKKSKYNANNVTVDSSSPSKTHAQYCIFILNLSCPYDKYDIIFEPRKTMVEFSEGETVLKLVEEVIVKFLIKENLYSDSDQAEPNVSKCVSNANTNFQNFDTHDCRQGLFSHVVRRLQKYEESNDVYNTPVNATGTVSNILSNDNIAADQSRNLILSSCNNNNPASESNSVNSEKSLTSVNKNSSIICLKSDASSTSVLDKLKSTTSKELKLTAAKPNILTTTCSFSHLPKKECDIPCRSVFPSESPVMMRIPVKSTLSDLPNNSSSTDLFLKLRKKFQYSPQKKNMSLNLNKFNRKNDLMKSNYTSKILLQNSSYLQFDQKKHNLKDNMNQSNLKDKSAQCPSVSLHCVKHQNHKFKNISDKEMKGQSVLKMQDKSLQCPSVSSNVKSCTISKFEFTKEPVISPLQRLQRSNRLERKTLRKNLEENLVITAEDLINNTNNELEILKSKKSKLYHEDLSSREVSNDKSIYEQNENISYSVEDLNNEQLINYYPTNFNRFSKEMSVDSSIDIYEASALKHTDDVKSGQLDLSTFRLCEFTQNNNLSSGSCINMIKNLEVINIQKKNISVNKNNLANQKDVQTSSVAGETVGINYIEEVLEAEPYFSDIESNLILKKFIYKSAGSNFKITPDVINYDVNNSENCLNQMSPDLHTMKNNIFNKSASFESNGLSNFQVKNDSLLCNKSRNNAEDESSPIIEFQHKSTDNSTDQSTSDKIPSSLSPDVISTNNFISTKNCTLSFKPSLNDNNDLKFSPESLSTISSSGLIEKNNSKGSSDSNMHNKDLSVELEKNSLYQGSDFSEVQNKHLKSSVNASGDNLLSDVNMGSIPFSEYHPSLSTEKNNSKEIFESITSNENSNAHQVCDDLGMESLLSELPKTDEDVQTTDIKNFKNFIYVHDSNLSSDINLESNPFSECLLPESKNIALVKNNFKKRFDSISSRENCIEHQVCDNLEVSSSFSELPKLEAECSSSVSEHFSSTDSKVCKEFDTSNCESNKNKISNDNVVQNANNFIAVNHNSNTPDMKRTECLSASVNKDITHEALAQVHSNEKKKESTEQSKSCWKAHSEPETKRIVYIDPKTGNSTYFAPKEENILNIHNTEEEKGMCQKSHFFLTHDYSPFISKTQTSELDDAPLEFQNDLKNFVENQENNDLRRKWRFPKDESHDDSNIECMLSCWDNPMFNIPHEVGCTGEISQNLPQMYSFLNSYKFSQNTLKSLQVIGQVDCKFIACILQNCNEKCNRDQKLFALFDQHAVHERVRLEELIEDLYEMDQNGKKLVKSSAIDPPLKISFDAEEIRLLCAYQENLQQIGIHMTIDRKSQICEVNSVPLCLVYKGSKELRRNRIDSTAILQNAVTEWLGSLSKTRSIPQMLPRTLSSVLNYQACRGAVKFGDPLNLDQCKVLLESLSKCQLPFQCAHGRPSVAPILDLNKIEALYRKRPSPKIKNISMHLQEQCQP